ncbi:MAG: SDR family oxidoreductase [bacterium]
MKVLFIGGTGNISAAVSRLCIERGIDLYLLNRGISKIKIEGAKTIRGDINQPGNLSEKLQRYTWDAVVNWIAFNTVDIERDINLFKGKTDQYIFISSASAYQKPVQNPVITESTPLNNPFWEYSQRKIACEDALTAAYREEKFPMTIVRPSLTYDTVIPVAMGGWNEYTIIDRMEKGKKIIVHGDGTSLWTVTHSRDFAKGFVGLIGHPQTLGQAFHITSDEILTWNQIYQTVAEAADTEADIIHIASDYICRMEPSLKGPLIGDKAHSLIFDNSKIKRFVPEFAATVSFKAGIKQTLQWFEADASRMIVNKKTNIMKDRIIKSYLKK